MVETTTNQMANAEWAVGQLGVFKSRFDVHLRQHLNKKIQEASDVRPELGRLLEVCADFVIAGGKRLRPAFMYYGWKSVASGDDEETIMKAAIPMELVHAGALVHDDVMDNSDLRRGSPTVHKIFGGEWGSPQTGRSLAIVAGDMILALADEAMTTYSGYSDRHREARAVFDRMCREINYGQHLDVVGNLMGVVSEDWIMQVMRYKTAGYTVEMPLLIGATLGGASPQVAAGLSEYGVNLGIAFQVKDDILGMFGDERKVGKPVDSDLKEGKQTLLVATTLRVLAESGRQDEVTRFKQILGNPDLTMKDYLWCQEAMRQTGALDLCQSRVGQLTQKAKESVANIGIEEETRRYLLGISDFLVAREY